MPLDRLRDVPRLRAECLVDLAAELLGHLARALDQHQLDLARRLVELALHELGVRARLLAVEHPGADLDRVRDHPDGVGARLLALAGGPAGRLVVHDEAVDDHAVADRADMRLAEWSRGFHGDCRAYVAGRTE